MPDTSEPKKRRGFPWLLLIGVIAVGAVFAYSRYAPPNHIAWAPDLQTAREQAAKTGKPILMEFSASWCPACNAVKRNVWPDKRVEQFVNSHVIPLAVDVDQDKQLIATYRINPIPAFIVTDPTGEELARAEGYLDADALIKFIQSAESDMPGVAAGDAVVSAVRQSVLLPPGHPAAEN